MFAAPSNNRVIAYFSGITCVCSSNVSGHIKTLSFSPSLPSVANASISAIQLVWHYFDRDAGQEEVTIGLAISGTYGETRKGVINIDGVGSYPLTSLTETSLCSMAGIGASTCAATGTCWDIIAEASSYSGSIEIYE